MSEFVNHTEMLGLFSNVTLVFTKPPFTSVKWRGIVAVLTLFSLIILGIILVHDLTNKKSSQNLYRWSLEALNRDLVPTGVLVTNG